MDVRNDLLRICCIAVGMVLQQLCSFNRIAAADGEAKVSGDSVAAAPSVLFRELAAIRTERLFYAAASLHELMPAG